jgi:hypothetical protein
MVKKQMITLKTYMMILKDYLKKIKSNEQQKQDKKEAEEKGLDYVEITD